MAANHACSPYAPANIALIDRSSTWDAGQYLSALFRQAEAKRAELAALRGKPGAQREGFIGSFALRASKDLEEMSQIPLSRWEKWMASQGWLDEVTNIETGKLEYKPALMDPEKTGYATAIMKTMVEAHSGAIKQMADTFLMKVKAGGEPTMEGIQFARAMRDLSSIGTYVLGWDQGVGRGLMQSSLISKPLSRAAEGVTESGKTSLDLQKEYRSFFVGVAEMLSDPAQTDVAINELVAMAKRVQFLDEPWAISKATLGMEVAGNAWQELFVNGMLSSPTTQAVNAASIAWVPMRALLQLGTAEAWSRTGMWGSMEAQQVAVEAGAALTAMFSGMQDAFQVGWRAMRTDTSIFQRNHKAISSKAVNQWLTDPERNMNALGPRVGEVLDAIGSLVRLPGRIGMGMDETSKILAMRGETAAQGVRLAVAAGVNPTDKAAVMKFVQQELESSMDLSKENLLKRYGTSNEALALRDHFRVRLAAYDQKMVAYGQSKTLTDIANEATFQEDNWTADVANSILGRAPIMRPFFPFIRTPLNILKQGAFDGTGLTALWKGGQIALRNPTTAVLEIQKELLANPAETARVAGQIALTTALASSLYGMAMTGKITGGGPSRWTDGYQGKVAQDAWVAAGNVPYAIQLGDQWISFDRFGEPLAVVLRMAADLGMYSSWMSREEQDEAFAVTVGIAVSGLWQASFLSGMDSLSKVMSSDRDWALGNAVQQYMATQTPFGGLLAFVDRAQDPYKAAYGEGATFSEIMKVHEGGLGLLFAKVAQRLPGVGQSPQLIDQLTGRPVPIVPGLGPSGLNPLQMAIPVLPREGKANPVWQAVFDVQGGYRERHPMGGLKLTAAEQQELNRLMATVRIGGKTVGEKILEFRRRADVEQFVLSKGGVLPKKRFAIQRELRELIEDYYQTAEAQLLRSNKGVMERALTLDALSVARKGNQQGDAAMLENQLEGLLQRAERGY